MELSVMGRLVFCSRTIAVCLLVVSSAQVGCDNPSAAPARLPAAKLEPIRPQPPEKSAATAGEPLSLEECHGFAADFEAAVLRGDQTGVTERIDWNALLATATAGLDAPAEFHEQFVSGALSERGSLARQLASNSRTGGFRLLRVRSEGGEFRALYRSIQSSGVKYQELILGRADQGDICATDVFFFKSAERLSRTMRRMYLLAAAEQPSNPLAEMLSRENDFVRHAKEFRRMTSLLTSGKGQEVLELYDSLPPQLQTEKTVMLLYVQAAEQVDDATYSEAIDRFRQAHPDDSCLDMISIDGYVLREQFDEALQAIDRIDASVGGDPYMNVLRANIQLMRGDPAAARTLAEEALQQEPRLIDAYWALVTVSLTEKRFADTAAWLTSIREKFDVQFGDLRKIPDYAEFVESPEYVEWSEQASESRGGMKSPLPPGEVEPKARED